MNFLFLLSALRILLQFKNDLCRVIVMSWL